jgi:ferredoxin
MLLKQQFGQMITQGNYKQVLSDKNNSFTQTLIDFIAWGITNFFGFASFLAAITILGFLLGPWGIVLTLALTYVYITYKKDIDERIRSMKGESLSSSLPPASQYQTSYQPPPPSAYPAPAGYSQPQQYAQQITPQQQYSAGAAAPYVAPSQIASLGYYYQIDERCTGCGDCVPHCPRNAIFKISQKYIIDQSHCNQSGRCVDKCPVGAIVRKRD